MSLTNSLGKVANSTRWEAWDFSVVKRAQITESFNLFGVVSGQRLQLAMRLSF
jgi:hypothetical protein